MMDKAKSEDRKMPGNRAKSEDRKMPGSRKKPEILKKLYELIKDTLVPTAVLTVFWLVLGWLKSAGIKWAILWPLNFLTGALNGLNGSFWGGVIGKTLLAMCISGLVRGVIARKGTKKEKRKEFLSEAQNTALSQIPMFDNIKMLLSDRTPLMLGCSGLGVGCALLIYPFITSGGSLVNSMVCLMLFFNICSQISSRQGLLMAILHLILGLKPFTKWNRDAVDRVVIGFAVGMALSVLAALLREIPVVGSVLWWIVVYLGARLLAAAGFVGIFWTKLQPFVKTIAAVAAKKGGDGK